MATWRARLRRFAAVASVVLLLVVVFGAAVEVRLLDRAAKAERMAIAGRRGDITNWPENTLPSIRSAAALEADAIEFDVQSSADGTFYLMHDPTVDRTTNGSGAVGELHDADIDALRVDGGLGFAGQAGIGVPTLEAVLNALADYRGMLLLDAKGGPEEHAAIARLILERHLQDRAWICTYSAAQSDAVAAVGAVSTYGRLLSGADHLMSSSPFWLLDLIEIPTITAIGEHWTGPETRPREEARRLGVRIYITNELGASLSWNGAR